ncbi:MAG TPA: hypothetical protein V6C46_09020 [Coleofasciculaceae cyanobacterium]
MATHVKQDNLLEQGTKSKINQNYRIPWAGPILVRAKSLKEGTQGNPTLLPFAPVNEPMHKWSTYQTEVSGLQQ